MAVKEFVPPPSLTRDDPRLPIAFPTLTDDQVRVLEAYGKRAKVPAGEYVWKAGTPDMCLYVIVDGEMQILDGRSGSYIASHRAGSFSGDVDIISGRPTVVSAYAATDLDLIKVPGDCVRTIVGEQPALGELILRTFLMRRSLLLESEMAGPLIIGSRFNPDTLRIREFLARNHYPAQWDDLEKNPDTGTMLREFQLTEEQTPLVLLPNGEKLHAPTNVQLADALGIRRPVESKLYDLVVIGAGPAGLAAAVYGASEGLETIIVDGNGPGGQAGTSSRIENYMGFPLGITGQQLADGAVAQAEKFGARFVLPSKAVSITCDHHGGHIVTFDDGEPITCRCAVLAPGASYRRLDVEDFDKFDGRGIYYSATNIERMLCKDEFVAIVGGGNSAGQAAVYMSECAKHVYLVVRGNDLRKTMSSYLAKRIEGSERITVKTDCEVCGLHGEEFLEAASILNKQSGEKIRKEISRVFVMIGAEPHTDWLPPKIARDSNGFIITGQRLVQEGLWKQSRPPFFLETSCPGVFAAGDARADSVKRVASAVGEGSMAVAFIHQFLAL